MMARGYLATEQRHCYDARGREIPCAGSGQDGEWRRGLVWPAPRFVCKGELVADRLTGLAWARNANLAEFPLRWPEALAFVADMNRTHALGFADWRLPNRRELRGLLSHQTSRPALPFGHPFTNVFPGWYWSSTTSAFEPDWAWALYLAKGAVGVGQKGGTHFHVWAMRDEQAR
jgi:hypothetical protein